ncbi:hypothetical protein [Cryobacterium sp. 10C3]|uniref:hypothetical protein n=1 Tax=Cryobacterium sp. 10C3 TaxID=3048577 RepID=UPI002AB4EDC5|nr:hypothetical protein [Cryobacterium sp. 10C3]MDY7556116.1 hypothetical protein [Cryobacterium sp. 10C3]
MKSLLRRNLNLYNPNFQVALNAKNPKREPSLVDSESYTQSELRRILDAARADIRVARDRIRSALILMDRWRRGEFDQEPHGPDWVRGAYLDNLARTGDLLRYPASPAHPERAAVNPVALRKAGFLGAAEARGALFLTPLEAMAFAVLLVGLTGENVGTIYSSKASSHQAAAGDKDRPAVAIIDLIKPRRGKSRAAMAKPLTSVPAWAHADAYEEGPQLLTSFGVFALLVELAGPARSIMRSDHLFACSKWTGAGGRGFRIGGSKDVPGEWGETHRLLHDDGSPLRVLFPRLRLTYVQAHDEPVAQTRYTLRDSYQVKDRGSLKQYQEIVEKTLTQQIASARAANALTFLTDVDVQEARTNPAEAALRYGVTPHVLTRILDGHLDTVLSACSDNENGPLTPGRPCEASFLMCAGCPCSVSIPAHWPVQVATHDALVARRKDMTALQWAQRYAEPWARLADIVSKMPVGSAEVARKRITQDDRNLVERLLNREMDH